MRELCWILNRVNEILGSEMVYATGCTEPGAIAYAASAAKDQLEGACGASHGPCQRERHQKCDGGGHPRHALCGHRIMRLLSGPWAVKRH